MKRIAILGAGFAGLAVCWFLLKRGGVEVTLFDRQGPGGGASGTSAGLLHPFTGPNAKVPWNGLAAFDESRQLLAEVAPETVRADGILRMAMSAQQRASFLCTSQTYPTVQWVDDCRTVYPHLAPVAGILLSEGLTVHSQLYLEALYKRCQRLGMLFKKQEISSLQQFDAYAHVIVALGAEITGLPEFAQLPLRQVKGQILQVKWPEKFLELPLPITAGVYLVPGSEVVLGATYEKTPFPSANDFAHKELIPKLCEMVPAFPDPQIIGTRSGLRAVLAGHLPLVKQIDERIWIFTGLGSKGLLYHAWLAKRLADSLA